MTDINELAGYWEVRGVIGTRIEIIGNRLTVLWRSAPNLETTFETAEAEDGGTELILKDRGLRNGCVGDVYATVEHLTYKDGSLVFDKKFEISGPSQEVLTKTLNSRYGNVTIKGELLETVQGKWVMERNSDIFFKISGNCLTVGDDSFTIRAAVNNDYRPKGEDFAIINRDPAKEGVGYYYQMLCFKDEIRAYILVCDVGLQEMKFKRA